MNEPIRMVADALADDDHGINAQLAYMAGNSFVEAGDTLPDDVTVTDESRDTQAALGRGGSGKSRAIVFLVGLDTLDPADSNLDRPTRVTIGVRFETQSPTPEQNVQDINYLLRATMASLRWWTKASGESFRLRNGIQLLAPTALGVANFAADASGDQITLGVKLDAAFADAFDYT